MTEHVIPGDLLARAKIIAGLRQLADYLDTHPLVPVCIFGWDLTVYSIRAATEAGRRAEVDRIAALLGVPVTDQTRHGGHYTASRSFGLITYNAICVPDQRRAAHEALMTYADCITPDPLPKAVAR